MSGEVSQLVMVDNWEDSSWTVETLCDALNRISSTSSTMATERRTSPSGGSVKWKANSARVLFIIQLPLDYNNALAHVLSHVVHIQIPNLI